MPQRLTFEYNALSYAYPDDESDKEVFFQATSPGTFASHLRAVLLYWVNMVFTDGDEVWQVVRLDRRQSNLTDVHKYVYPDMIVVDGCEREHHETISLGVFTRDQREAVLECADDVGYDERSPDQEEEEVQCLRWMSELLERMVEERLVARSVVDAIRDAVPLP